MVKNARLRGGRGALVYLSFVFSFLGLPSLGSGTSLKRILGAGIFRHVKNSRRITFIFYADDDTLRNIERGQKKEKTNGSSCFLLALSRLCDCMRWVGEELEGGKLFFFV